MFDQFKFGESDHPASKVFSLRSLEPLGLHPAVVVFPGWEVNLERAA